MLELGGEGDKARGFDTVGRKVWWRSFGGEDRWQEAACKLASPFFMYLCFHIGNLYYQFWYFGCQ